MTTAANAHPQRQAEKESAVCIMSLRELEIQRIKRLIPVLDAVRRWVAG